MAGLIPKSFIDELITRTDIVELIGKRISLKKAGQNYTACCPFHNEKTPSFSVSPSKQFYHCFGCGESGNVIGFLMNHDRLSFVEAIEELASLNGLTVPYEGNKKPIAQSKELYELMNMVCSLFQQNLDNSNIAQKYLANRKISTNTIKEFSLGYSPDSYDFLRTKLAPHTKDLIRSGMLNAGQNNRPYDRFRNRIMFPIHDKRGRIVGFGGRAFGDANPKYLNSPETEIYHKSQVLYGLYQVQKSRQNHKYLIVVEGYIDVIALFEHGITNAVATLGTATSTDHINLLFRSSDRIIFCFDGDRAGKDAAWRALNVMLPLLQDNKNINFLFLPDGQDPDSFVNEFGAEVFLQQLKNALSLSTFMFNNLEADVNLATIEGKAQFASAANNLINKITALEYKKLLQNEVNKKTNFIQLNKTKNNNFSQKMPKSVAVFKQKPSLTTVELAIAMLLQNPNLERFVEPLEIIERSNLPNSTLLTQIARICRNSPHITTGRLVENWRQTPQQQIISKLASFKGVDNSLEINIQTAFIDYITAIINDIIATKIKNTLVESLDDLSDVEKQNIVNLQRNTKKLNN